MLNHSASNDSRPRGLGCKVDLWTSEALLGHRGSQQ